MAALLTAMTASVAYAVPGTVKPNDSITTEWNKDNPTPSASYAVTKDGQDTLYLTGDITKNSSLYVREGEVVVGSTDTTTHLTLAPAKPKTDEDIRQTSFCVAGKDAVLTFVNASYTDGNNPNKHVGGKDGSGTLNITEGSKVNSGDCELFSIGVASATNKTTVSSKDSSSYSGTYHPAANGSNNSFGRGDVVVSGGSEFIATYRSFWMGEGSLTATGEKTKVQIGYNKTSEGYVGYRTLLAVGDNTTSIINVNDQASMEVYAYNEFNTNRGNNTTSAINVNNGTFSVEDVTLKDGTSKYTTVQFGGYYNSGNTSWGANSETSLNVENGGTANLHVDRTMFGNSDMANNGGTVKVNVADSSSTLNIQGQSASIYAGTTFVNKGTTNVNIDGTFYIYGGDISNEGQMSVSKNMSVYNGSLANTGNLSVANVTLYNGSHTNTGNLSVASASITGGNINNEGKLESTGSVTISGTSNFTNSGSISSSYTWIKGNADVTFEDKSSVDQVYLGGNATLTIQGNVSITDSLSGFSVESAKIIFTEGSSIDMNGSAVVLGDIALEFYVEMAHVDDSTLFSFNEAATLAALETETAVNFDLSGATALDATSFFINYDVEKSDISADTKLIIRGQDGSYTERTLGNINSGVVPEPTTATLSLLALAALAARRRRR